MIRRSNLKGADPPVKGGPASSPIGRLLRLGSLVGRIGASVAVEQLFSLVRSGPSRKLHQIANLVRNAERIVHDLGELKGAAMKVGQMLSLQDTLLPPEVTAVLRSLQQQAPPIPFDAMKRQLDAELPGWRKTIKGLEPAAIAAASIGQVHRGVLRDGRRVAVKIQYPGIDSIIEADLVNLRRLLKSLFALFTAADFGPVWGEVRDRLREELDYVNEAENIRRMAELWAGSDEVVIPGVIDEASSRRVLTMEYVAGYTPDEACDDARPQALRDRWGAVLYDFVLRGLFEHRFIHADPNLANFSFLADGRVVVYDYGCVKSVPRPIVKGYRELVRAALDGRHGEVPALLAAMGVSTGSGRPVSAELVAPVLDLVLKMLDDEHPYRFGYDDQLLRQLIDMHVSRFGEMKDLRFPHHIIFINRTVAGHLGNLSRLRAAAPWRRMLAARLA
ncbi:MAG: AarF/ABC1/UbiB kinase family protein [Betaproteobacteria bacterium]|nr:AarF/ABC1/UbiB kinase family protein [Betaproteobacteria bacterium]MBK9609150.1 AarF/ABC1/UbiB kinase family protein [Betaproteobacteria bacterium]